MFHIIGVSVLPKFRFIEVLLYIYGKDKHDVGRANWKDRPYIAAGSRTSHALGRDEQHLY